MASRVVVVVPSVQELTDNTDGPVACDICGVRFKNKAARALHQRKLHFDNGLAVGGRDQRRVRCRVAFYCPVAKCQRCVDGSRPFNCLRLVRQHYNKVHMEHGLLCRLCRTKRFSLARDLRYHEDRCGAKRTSGSAAVERRDVAVQCDWSTAASVDAGVQCEPAEKVPNDGLLMMGPQDDPLLTSTFCQTYLPMADASVGTNLMADLHWFDDVVTYGCGQPLTNSETQTDDRLFDFTVCNYLNSIETQTSDTFLL